MKYEYQMTQAQHAKLMEACKPVPAMYLSGGQPMFDSPQESANEAWRRLGLEMGFDHMTVEPISGQPDTYFRAEAAADPLIEDVPVVEVGTSWESVAAMDPIDIAAELDRLSEVERAARDLIKTGLRLTPDGLIVRESADKSDPHYRLCEALEAIAPLNPKKL